MIHVVLPTFSAARIANLCAQLAKVVDEPRAATHESGGRPADDSAVLVETNALRHVTHVPLAQACFGAVLALLGTANARLDARLMLFVGHCPYLRKVVETSWQIPRRRPKTLAKLVPPAHLSKPAKGRRRQSPMNSNKTKCLSAAKDGLRCLTTIHSLPPVGLS
jgi:hypothetical protein